MIRLVLALLLTLGSGCEETRHRFPDVAAVLTDSGSAAADIAPSPADTAPPDTAPAARVVAESLRGATWLSHLSADILPYWTSADALGSPPGNFPTYRGMDGAPDANSERRPRMLSRQTYLYVVAFMLTGDPAQLEHARAGVDWLLTHAVDQNGACHARLDASGEPLGDDAKTAQDVAYCGLGLAAWTFLTRDPATEAAVLKMRDLLFDPTTFWDAANSRIKDGLSADLSQEFDVESDGGWELVAQLDAINALLLLIQPVLSEASRRTEGLEDLRLLGESIVQHFHADGIFWGVHNKQGQYGTRHADFGHTLKTYWMLWLIDQRLPDHPFASLLGATRTQLDRAWDAPNGRWAKRPLSASTVEYGNDWWSYAEADQLAASLNLLDGAYTQRLEQSAAHWMGFVDTTRTARELVPGIDRTGVWVWDWADGDTAKCNQWKSGFHSAEHALVLYLTGQILEGKEAVLHFAPIGATDGLVMPAYLFSAVEAGREITGTTVLSETKHTLLKVRYSQLL
ncbi:MAG: mannose/cellobiose epimerase-like protein (N-acyl-D-glucosamine 2-epimerase family) [Myxococcota bacterium]|jgi:mannose/cellobiose epimerase-like protein (N-acyl-D-glucosamine 2-epimerase family)